MRFVIDRDLLTKARAALLGRSKLYWLVGGAGSGKTTISQILSSRYDIPVYDMDAHVYGAYHERFTRERHPVNYAWSTAPNGLAWLLTMSWDEFNGFNQAALPEYLDLFFEDIAATDPGDSMLVDGGICNPALLAQAMPAHQIVCLAVPHQSSEGVWQATDERGAMKEAIYQLSNPEETWRRFLEFDSRITHTILKECQEANISICERVETESADDFAERVARALGIGQNRLDVARS
jgi:hypothetical protein